MESILITKKEELNQFQNKYIVYIHTSPEGKKYCGFSGNIKRRWQSINEYYSNILFYRALQKYGWENFKHEIVFISDSKEEALQYEKETIEKLDLLNPKKGYNLVEGGGEPPHGKQYISSEGLEKMKANGKRLAEEIWGNPEKTAYVKQRMKEEFHKARMAMTQEQRNKSFGEHNKGNLPPNAKIIYQLDKDTLEVIAEYPSSGLAAMAVVGNKGAGSNIRAAARGEKNSAYGYKWRWKDDYFST